MYKVSQTPDQRRTNVKKEVKFWNAMILYCSGAWLALYIIATSARVYDAVISRRNFVCF